MRMSDDNLVRMKKRIVVAILWFYATWVAWAMVAQVMGFTDLIGPVLGTALAAFIAGDPMHRIWSRSTDRTDPTRTAVPATAQ